MLIEAFVSQLPVEALDIGVLNRLPRLNKPELDLALKAQRSRALLINSGPLSTVITSGNPRVRARRSSTRLTRCPVSEWPASKTGHSQLKSSTTVNIRKRRTLKRLSETKSMTSVIDPFQTIQDNPEMACTLNALL